MPSSLQDMRFLIHDVFAFEAHYATLAASAVGPMAEPPDRSFIDAVLDEGYRFAENELAPLPELQEVGVDLVEKAVLGLLTLFAG